MSNLNNGGLTRVLNYIKTWVNGLLSGKSDTSHTHTKSQITDFPSIPSKTSQLTNDSGYLTSHQSLSNYLDKSTEQTISAFKIGKGNSTAGFAAQSADGTYRATLMVGSGGCNRGIWDDYLQMWIVYANDTACYLNGTATKATYNANGKELVNSIIKGLSVSGRTITYTKLDGSTGTLTTQDTNTTYSNFVKSGSGAKAGLVPAPSTTAGTTKYLREDGTWQVPPDHTYTVNNATLTIQKNGSNVATFTANASSNVTANISVPTKVSQLTNDSGFITSEINSSGSGWVRFKSGLQICFGVATAGQNNAFPKAFKSGTIPHINLTHYTSNNMPYSATVQFGTGGSTTSTTFNFLLWQLTSGSYANYECHYTAIGLWK